MSVKLKNGVQVEENRGHTRVQWLVILIVSISSFTYGMEIGWISPSTKILQSELSPTGYPLSDDEVAWLGSSMSIAAGFSVGFYTYIADKFGRKVGILAITVPQVVTFIIKLLATDTLTLLVSRIVAGFPSGGSFNVIPMYIREISQDNVRGAGVSTCLLMQNFGLLFMYAMGSYLDYWLVLWISMCAPIIAGVFMLFAPESPAFLVKKDKFDEADKTVALLRGLKVDDKIVQDEVRTMRDSETYYKSLPKITFFNIFRNKASRHAFTIVGLIVSAQALNGVYSIMMFAWSILSSTGVALDPALQTLVIPVLLIFGSIAAILSVERLGRKPLLVIAYMLTSAAMACMGTVLLLQTHGIVTPKWISMVVIAVSVWSYSAGVTPAFYVVLSEIFNFQVRGKLIGCIVTYAWLASSCQLLAFAPVSNLFGIHTMFFIFAGINLFGCAVSLVLLPETKGKSMEEIEKILGK